MKITLPTRSRRHPIGGEGIGRHINLVVVSTNLSPGLWLSPPERWAASCTLKRQRTNRNASVLRLENNYGPVGIELMAAAYVWFFTGWIIAVTGVVIIVVSGTRDLVGYYLTYVGIAFEVLVMIRCAQGGLAGRLHRGGRPMVE